MQQIDTHTHTMQNLASVGLAALRSLQLRPSLIP